MNLSKKERRELRREERGQEIAWAQRKKQIKTWSVRAAVFLVILGGGFVLYKSFSQKVSVVEIGEPFPIEGTEHVADGMKVTYTTNPPASGAHYGVPANWGVYDHEIPDEAVVHNLEHGGVWISYHIDSPNLTKTKLRAIAENNSKVVLSPRAKNDSPIALVSWGRVHKMTVAPDGSFNEDIVKNFILKYKNKGPELVPDNMPGKDY